MATVSVAVGEDWVELTDGLSTGNWAMQVLGSAGVELAVAATAADAASAPVNRFAGGEWCRFGRSSDSTPVWARRTGNVDSHVTLGSINMNDPRPI